MGSVPFLATAEHGKRFLDVTATSLAADLQRCLEEHTS
jgi:creatinine amidohydrolase/Fe(II)-dependent formamide hydrolase-like protein